MEKANAAVDREAADILEDSTMDRDSLGNDNRNKKKKSKLLQRDIPLMGEKSGIGNPGDEPTPVPKVSGQDQQEKPTSSSRMAALQSRSAPSVSVGARTTVNRSVFVPSNPLLMEDVMEHVFKYITCQSEKKKVAHDLKNFRLVCKPWRNAATRLYRRSAPVMNFGSCARELVYKGRQSFEALVHTFGNLKNFLETMKCSEMIPSQRYKITGSLDTQGNQKLMVDFLRICGPSAVSAEFHLICSNNFQGYVGLEGPSEMDLSKLRTLFVDIFDRSRLYSSSEALVSLHFTEAVLNAAKSLRELKLEVTLPEHYNYNQSSLKTFEKEICERIPESLKSLDFQMFPVDQTFTYLTERGLKLEKFVFDPCHVAGGSDAIHSFLTSQSGHLKALGIKSSKLYSDAPMLDLPVLSKLETLTMAYACVTPFSFAEKLPNLICLEVARWEDEVTLLDFLECAAETAPSVKKIKVDLPRPHDFAIAPKILKFAEYFPNITELRLDQATHYQEGIGNVLEKVFAHLTNLEILHITIMPVFRATNLDSIFSGVSEEDCKRIRNGRNFDGVNLATMQTKPSMLNLTRLRKLVLTNGGYYYYRNLGFVTEFSIYFVLLKLAELEELTLTSFEFALNRSKISKTYLQRLKDKVRLTVATTTIR